MIMQKVLVIDDEPQIRRALRVGLEQNQYEVLMAATGEEGLDIAASKSPDLIVLDIAMPGKNGFEVCKELREWTKTPIIILSVRDNEEEKIRALDLGADDYLTKPFDVDELRARVRTGKRILDLQAALIHAQDDLQSAAAHDSLTGLWNRGATLDLLRREVFRRQRTWDALGVIMADIDSFKRINDTHGHLIGDVVLQEVTRRLAVTVRPYDAVGRYGGEEFLIVLPACNASNLVVGAERLRCCIAEQPIETSVGQIPVTRAP